MQTSTEKLSLFDWIFLAQLVTSVHFTTWRDTSLVLSTCHVSADCWGLCHALVLCVTPKAAMCNMCATLGDFNFWLSLSLSLSLSETLSRTLKSGLRPKFNLTSV